MKKTFNLILLVVFLVGLSGICFAQVEEKKEDLDKVRKYMLSLDEKIKEARAGKKINKIAEIKEFKRKALERAKVLKTEIEKEGGVVEEIIVIEEEEEIEVMMDEAGWLGKVGYGGGAAILEGGYLFPIKQHLNAVVSGGLGIGNGYTIICAGVCGMMPFGQNYAGLEAGLANYSQTIADVLGLSGNVSSGIHLGIGFFVGTNIRDLEIRMGYNTALGITAGVIRRW
jgi:hypothetical protein